MLCFGGHQLLLGFYHKNNGTHGYHEGGCFLYKCRVCADAPLTRINNPYPIKLNVVRRYLIRYILVSYSTELYINFKKQRVIHDCTIDNIQTQIYNIAMPSTMKHVRCTCCNKDIQEIISFW